MVLVRESAHGTPVATEAAGPPTGGPGDATKAKPTDVQLARALEVLKSWTYFEQLRQMREESGDADRQAVAVRADGESEDSL